MAIREYFPGANTPVGFYSYYSDILTSTEAQRIIILKGGPGTGKSSFMKKVARHLTSLGYDSELLHCSSDPNSLDGVCARDIGFLILDGTSPHVVDPKCPGAVDEIINLGDCWDADKIRPHKNAILKISHSISDNFARAYRYFSAAKDILLQLQNDYDRITRISAIDEELLKIKNDLSLEESQDNSGKERRAFLSAITPMGRVSYVDSFCDTSRCVYKIIANNFKSSGIFMRALADCLIKCGHNIRTFYCPMSPGDKIEHIYDEELDTFFTTGNSYYGLKNDISFAAVNLDQYVNCSDITSEVWRDTEQYKLLLQYGEECIRTAKQLHDKLEEYYIPHMDFDKVDSICDNVIESII